jgi:hypothetical protein
MWIYWREVGINLKAKACSNALQMGLFGFVLLVVIVLAVLGLGWQMFSSGVISGFEKAIDIGTPIIKNLTQEARDHGFNPPTSKD